MIECNTLSFEVVLENLKEICKKKKIKVKEETLREVARRCGGDMRSAIIDLEMLKYGDMDLGLIERNRTEDILKALFKVFKTKDARIAGEAFYVVNEDIGKQILWLEENLPKEYEGEDLAKAFDCLSRADVFIGRIRRWQHWRFLIYANNMISSGVALSKKEKNKKQVVYKPTTRILKLWMANMKYQKRKAIAAKIGEKCHTSSKRALEILPYMKHLIKQGNEGIIKDLDLSEDEVTWLRK